jgi:hypothetical protein
LKNTKPDLAGKQNDMNKDLVADKLEITEIINRLFVYTDNRQWDQLQSEVFASEVDLDMTSMGAEQAARISSGRICQMWEDGFKGLDAVHHQAGNYLIDVKENKASAIAYSIASHFKSSASKGKTRTFVGSYDLHLTKLNNSWRIDGFTYHLRYSEGNLTLE